MLHLDPHAELHAFAETARAAVRQRSISSVTPSGLPHGRWDETFRYG